MTLYFGELHYPDETVPSLKEALRSTFKSAVKLNSGFKRTGGTWPTLGEAIEANERVFAFVRSDLVRDDELDIMREVQVALDEERHQQEGEQAQGQVKILSTYKSCLLYTSPSPRD